MNSMTCGDSRSQVINREHVYTVQVMAREGLRELDCCVLMWTWRCRRLEGSGVTGDNCRVLSSSACASEPERARASSGPT